jgi:hypothetical protein
VITHNARGFIDNTHNDRGFIDGTHNDRGFIDGTHNEAKGTRSEKGTTQDCLIASIPYREWARGQAAA